MKFKLFAMSALVALSFSANAGMYTYSIYHYLDASGSVVGKLIDPCGNRQDVVIGTSTSTKVHVETGSCM